MGLVGMPCSDTPLLQSTTNILNWIMGLASDLKLLVSLFMMH
jgi:hypothetical protein